MTCNDFERLLDDYLDDELLEDERQLLEKHLDTCLPCNRTLKQLRSLIDAARELPAEIEPEKPLWPGIESRIAAATDADAVGARTQATSIRFWQWASLAAAAVLVLAISLPQLLERQPLQPATDIASSRADAEATAMLARSEDGVLLPRSDLLTVLEEKRSALSAEEFLSLEASATLVDQAIAEVRAALDQNPGDRRLEHLLASRYQQEVALLRQVNRV